MIIWLWTPATECGWFQMCDDMALEVEKAFTTNASLTSQDFTFVFPFMICVHGDDERLIRRLDKDYKDLPWMYEDECGQYNLMEPHDCSTLSIARKHYKSIQLHGHHQSYKYDFVNNTQHNMQTCKVRSIIAAPLDNTDVFDDDAPEELVCPINFCLMTDPVMAADGKTYQRSAIERWFVSGRMKDKHVLSPNTNEPMVTARLYPNLYIKERVDTWMKLDHKGQPDLSAAKRKKRK